MNRRERQSAILELVRERALSTQAEVASALRETGFEVVQTTVPRNHAALGLRNVEPPIGPADLAPPESGAPGLKFMAEEVTKRSNGPNNMVFHGGTLLNCGHLPAASLTVRDVVTRALQISFVRSNLSNMEQQARVLAAKLVNADLSEVPYSPYLVSYLDATDSDETLAFVNFYTQFATDR